MRLCKNCTYKNCTEHRRLKCFLAECENEMLEAVGVPDEQKAIRAVFVYLRTEADEQYRGEIDAT